MRGLWLAMALGCGLGALGTYGVVATVGETAAGGSRDSTWRAAVGRLAPWRASGAVEGPSVAERRDTYRAAAALGDAAAAEAALRRASDAAPSPHRELAIDAYLARLADLDIAHAVRAADALGLVAPAVALVDDWAARDPLAALQTVRGLGNAAVRQASAVALLENGGLDLAQVAAALRPGDRAPLFVEWLAARAEHEPEGALRDALAAPDVQTRRAAVARVGAAWADRDPQRAAARAAELPAELQREYVRRVSERWAQADPSAYLRYAAQRMEADGR